MQPNVVQFSEASRSAIIPIYRPDLVEKLQDQALHDGFEEKEEFHVTILPTVDDISQVDPKDLQAFRIALTGKVDDIRVVEQEVFRINKPKRVGDVIYPRESIIARIHSSSILRMLGSRMMNGFGIYVPTPFLHVTLFTKGDNEFARRGIGIDSVQEFMALHPERYPEKREG
jgi:hypothetical protein